MKIFEMFLFLMILYCAMNVSKNKAFRCGTTSQKSMPNARSSRLSCLLLPSCLHSILLLYFCAGADPQGGHRRKTATMLLGRLPGQSGTGASIRTHGQPCPPICRSPSFLGLYPSVPSFRRQRNRQHLRAFTRLRLPRSRLATCRYRIFFPTHRQ